MTPLLHAVMAAALTSNGVADPPPMPLAERFDVFGLEVCLGSLDDAERCDLHLFAPQASPASTPTRAAEPAPQATLARHETRGVPAIPSTTGASGKTVAAPGRSQGTTPRQAELEPLEISLLGRTVCLGHVTGDASCDVNVFPRRREEAAG